MDLEWLSLASLITACACAFALLWRLRPDKRLVGLPSPTCTLPILGNTLDLLKPGLYDWITDECVRHRGRTWRLKLIGQPPIAVVSSVEAFADVMKTQFEIFEKGETVCYLFKDAAGEGIVSVDGDEWKAQRKVLVHLFTSRAFRETISDSIMHNVRALGRVLEKSMQSNRALDFTQVCHRFTYDTFVKVGFGIESKTLTEGKDDAISEAMDAISIGIQWRFLQPTAVWKLFRWLRIGVQGHMMHQIKVFDKIAYGIVHECLRRKKSDGDCSRKANDVISIFVDQSSLKVDPVFLRDTGVTLLFAGRDTTATAMTWCNLMLNRFPDKAKLVHEELRTVLHSLFDNPEYVPNMDDVDLLVYLEAFVRETLRLFPIAPLNSREANRDTTLSDGTFIAKGSRVFIPSYSLGRMKSVWGEDALEFTPERWIDINPKTNKQMIRKVSAFQFPAFHGGPRVCIGMRFAMLELKTALAYVLSKYELQTIREADSFTYSTALLLALDGPMMVNVLPAARVRTGGA